MGLGQVISGLTFLICKMGSYSYPCHPASPESPRGRLGAWGGCDGAFSDQSPALLRLGQQGAEEGSPCAVAAVQAWAFWETGSLFRERALIGLGSGPAPGEHHKAGISLQQSQAP